MNLSRWLNMVAGDETGLTSQLISTSSLSTQSLQGCTTPPGSMHATLYKQHCGFFYVPQESEEWKNCETGRMVFRPYSRRLECLTFCRCHCRGSTFSSVILRPQVLVQPRFEPATTCSADRHLPNWAHWAMVNVTVSNEHLHKIFLLFSFIFLNSYRIAFILSNFFRFPNLVVSRRVGFDNSLSSVISNYFSLMSLVTNLPKFLNQQRKLLIWGRGQWPGFANFIDEYSQCDFWFTNFGVILEYLESSITTKKAIFRLSSTWSWHVYTIVRDTRSSCGSPLTWKAQIHDGGLRIKFDRNLVSSCFVVRHNSLISMI